MIQIDGGPTNGSGARRPLFEPADAVLLLLDHQTGLLQTVQDVGIVQLRRNVTALARLASMMDVPVITTASEPRGPNGPLIPELELYAPHAVYVPRNGEISAWDNPDFVRTVRALDRRTLIIAGIWTSVCVMFPALQAAAEGYHVQAVMDASGDPSEIASRSSIARFAQAGIIPTTTNAVVCEFQRTWNRPDAAAYAELYGLFSPAFIPVMESHSAAARVAAEATADAPTA